MANLIAAAIVVGFAIGEMGFTPRMAAGAVATWGLAMLFAIVISRGTS